MVLANSLVEARGVEETKRAFNNLARNVIAGAVRELNDWGDEIVRDGRNRLAAREAGFAMRRQPGSFGSEVRSTTTKAKAVVFVERDGTSPAAEFGARSHTVFGRKVKQTSMRRRTAAGWSRKGRIVGPEFTAIKVRKRAKRLADRQLKDTSKTLDRYGVPRR